MKLFKNIITSLFLVLVITTVINLVYIIISLFFNVGVFYQGSISVNAKSIFIIKAIALLIFIFSVFLLIKSLKFIVQRDFFNPNLIQSISRSGKFFLISGSLGLLTSVFGILNALIFKEYIMIHNILSMDSRSFYIMLMILGAFFLLFSKVLNKGNQIQQENDLTI